MGWETDPTRWMTKDGQHYYLVPVSQLGYRTVEQIHSILKKAERAAYVKNWHKHNEKHAQIRKYQGKNRSPYVIARLKELAG